MLNTQANTPRGTIDIFAPARLHLGFIDVTGAAGRQFGSIGLPINEIGTRLSLSIAEQNSISGPGATRAEDCLRSLQGRMSVSTPVALTLHAAIPEHIGLGSGTQMALAVATAFCKLHKKTPGEEELTQLIGRGARSGIGLASFEQGGLIVDGGRGPSTIRPPVIARIAMPENWRFILIFDAKGKGIHGAQERKAFADLPQFAASEAMRLAHLILMQALPALQEKNCAHFGAAITELQRTVGEYFSPAQGGRYTSTDVANALEWLQLQGAKGLGQSSWGPTGFCIAESHGEAEHFVNALKLKSSSSSNLEFMITSPRNRGADITVTH